MVEHSNIESSKPRPGNETDTPLEQAPEKPSLRKIGPGFVLAATCVGTGDLVSSIVAGGKTQYSLVWAVLVAVFIKYHLTIAIGRWGLATGKTIIQGFRSIGFVAIIFVAIYAVLWGLMYGAAGPAVVGMVAHTIAPVLDATTWAILHAVMAFFIVLIGRYNLLEKVMQVCIGLMFVGMVGTAVMMRPDLGALAQGLVPSLPGTSIVYVISIIGGLGGTLTLTAYGYWVRDKGWRGRSHLPLMRLDSITGYVAIAIFSVSMVIVGATFLHESGRSIDSADGLLNLVEPMRDNYGPVAYWLFLIGFWAIAYSSVLGVWSGVSYLFADVVRNVVRKGADTEIDAGGEQDEAPLRKTKAFRLYLVLLTIPPIPLILFGSPVFLVLAWLTLGAFFMPFLTISLLYLLNARKFGVRQQGQSLMTISNAVMGFGAIVFLWLMVMGLADVFGG